MSGQSYSDEFFSFTNIAHSGHSGSPLLQWLRQDASRLFDANEMNRTRRIPPPLMAALRNHGAFGLRIPREFGGLDLSMGETMAVVEQLAAMDVTLAAMLVGHQTSILPLLYAGTAPLQKRYLERLASGDILAAFALTERAAGSNPRAMRSTAAREATGGWRISGEKYMVGTASWAELLTTFARVEGAGITAFAVERNAPGVSIARELETFGLGPMVQNAITFNDVSITDDALIGVPGEGFEIARRGLAFGRLAVAAMALGIMKRCAQLMVRYAGRRRIATGMLIDNGVTRHRLEEIDNRIVAIEALAHRLADRIDAGAEISEESTIACKVAASEFASQTADELLQLLGARGYVEGNIAPRIVRNARFLRIGEGPTETLLVQLGALVHAEEANVVRDLSVVSGNDPYAALNAARRSLSDAAVSVDTDILNHALGQLAVWSYIKGAITDASPRAHAWAHASFDAELRRARKANAPPDTRALINRLAGYNADIGSLAQTLAVPDDELDPLLRADPRTTESARTSASIIYGTRTKEAEWRITVPELIAAQIKRTPAALAIETPYEQVSYADLDWRAELLARELVTRGVQRGDFVAVVTGRTSSLVVSALAVLRAGAAFVPLNADQPESRIESLMTRVGARVAITEPYTAAKVPKHLGAQICVSIGSPADADDGARISVPTNPSDPAYVIFTSGSTGVPKPVAIRHESLCNNLNWRRDTYGRDFYERALATLSPTFDPSIAEYLGPIAAGGTVLLSGEANHAWDPADIVKLIERFSATFICAVPSTLSLLLDALEGGACPSLRLVFSGGEALTSTFYERFAKLRRTRLANHYGPTETTIESIAWSGSLPENAGAVPIGRPIANTTIYLLDEYGEPAAEGESGEIFIGGAGVAIGYAGDELRTSERFVADPFSKRVGARMYRTGDRARMDASGSLIFLGRIDRQLKIRGVRIEPGEIEARLTTHSAVQQCVVVGYTPPAGDKRLVAFLMRSENHLDIAEVRAFAQENLPREMIPSLFVEVSEVPLTPSGKVNEPALLESYAGALSGTATSDALFDEWNVAERTIARIWHDVLDAPVLSRDADFFALGGHSLLAVRVLTRIHTELGTQIGIREFFAAPTIGALAARLSRNDEGAFAEAPVRRLDRNDLEPTTGQRRLWFLQQMAPASGSYNVPGTVVIKGALNVTAIERALALLVERNEGLRTVMRAKEGQPRLEIVQSPSMHLRIVQVNAGGWNEAVRDEVRRPFALESEIPFRSALFRIDDTHHVLAWTIHHAAADGWSAGGLVPRELAELYGAIVSGNPMPAPRPELQPVDFASWRANQTSPGAAAERWLERLADANTILELPTDRPRPPVRSFLGARYSFRVEADLVRGLREVARSEGVTLYAVLLAAYEVVLARWSRTRDFLVGSVIAGRRHPLAEEVIGHFAETVLLRARCDESATLATLIQRAHEEMLWAAEQGEAPLEKIAAAIHAERSPGTNPVFQVAFTLFNGAMHPPAFRDLDVAPHAVDPGYSKFDLALEMFDDNHDVWGYFEFDSALFDASTIVRFSGHFTNVLRAMIQDRTQLWCKTMILSHDEFTAVTRGFNNNQRVFPARGTVVDRFRAAAAASPDATALVSDDTTWTYAQLNDRSSALAVKLIDAGVRADARVAVRLERSFEQVAALLGVMMAGGAFIPLDPALPLQRVEDIIDDASAVALVTHSSKQRELSAGALPVLCVDEISDTPFSPSANVPALHDLAYVIYTSGSTGRPKGVAVEHAALANLCDWVQHDHEIDCASRSSHVNGLSFDASVMDVWPFLANGASVAIPSTSVTRDFLQFRDWLLEHRVTHSLMTTVLGERLLSVSWPDTTPLRWLMMGGEEMTAPPTRAFPFRTFNMYGPTEDTVVATSEDVTNSKTSRPPIGRPVTNTAAYVLDERKEPVPIGVPGELALGGSGLARGYIGHAGVGDKRFSMSSFSNDRLYHTGDLCRWHADGRLQFLGRNDRQIKLRGFRIELPEIEAAIQRHPSVRSSVALVVDAGAGERLVAYVVGNEETDQVDWNEWLGLTLPSYMIPALVHRIDEMPLTANGKIDLRALPSLTAMASSGPPPETETEHRLAGIWTQLLGGNVSDIDRTLFQYGGDSLLVMQLIEQMHSELGVRVPVSLLYEGGTVRTLAAHLARDEARSNPRCLVQLTHRDDTQPIFIVHPVSGLVSCYQDLAARIDRTVYGLQSPLIDSDALMEISIPDMAGRYLAALREVQPAGPYLLGGWSLGATVAFEMAHQLEAAGERVAGVIAFDGIAPRIIDDRLGTNEILILVLRELANRYGIEGTVDSESLDAMPESERYAYVAAEAERIGGARGEVGINALRRIVATCEHHMNALRDYHGSVIDAPITLFRAADQRHFAARPQLADIITQEDLGWAQHTRGKLTVLQTPGEHMSILFAENLQSLAPNVSRISTELLGH